MESTRQPSQLVAQRGAPILPAIVSAIIVLVIAAFLLAVQTLSTTGAVAQPEAGAAVQQLDSPALRKFEAGAASQQYDSPALRGGYKVIPAAPTSTTLESVDSLRQEHLGIAPATIKAAAPAVTLEDWNTVRMEHVRQVTKSQAAPAVSGLDGFSQLPAGYDAWGASPTVTGRDRIEIHRLEHLGKAPAMHDTWGAGR